MLWIERTPPRVHVQHQGVLAADEPSDEARLALRRHQGGAPARDARQAERVSRQAARRGRRRGVAAVPRRADAAALGGQARRRAVPVPAVVRDRRKNKAYIEECAERLPDYRVAVEFRHESWMSERNREETLSFLEERDLPYVCVDMPQGFVSSVPPIAAATADDLAMVRFHGRNTEAWSVEERDRLRALPLRLPEDELRGVGPEDRAARRRDPRDPRAHEQLLPRLRRTQRPRARRPPAGVDGLLS